MSDQPSRTLCCWPGLAGLWLRGHWSSLLLAVAFSLVLNLALVSTFVWPALLNSVLKIAIWPFVLSAWVFFGWVSWREMAERHVLPDLSDDDDDTLFIQAQTEYLRGELTQAELLLTQQLKADPRDAEARLLLATLYRRDGRDEIASQQLVELQKLDDGIPWEFEIQRERQLIASQQGEPEDKEEIDEQQVWQDAHLQNNETEVEPMQLGETTVSMDGLTRHDDHSQKKNPKRAA